MKRRILTGFAILLAIAMLAAACSSSGTSSSNSNSSSNTVQLDKNVNLAVPTSASAIQNFTNSSISAATTKAEAQAIIDAIFGEDGPFGSFLSVNQQYNSYSFNRSTANRAVKTEPLQLNFTEKDLFEGDDDLIKYLTIKGYIDATARYDDAREDFYALNGEAKARVEIKEGFTDDNYQTFGVVAGEIRANNITINGDKASGSVFYNINGAINVADTSNKSVKCIFKINSLLSISGNDITVTVEYTAYGNNNTLLLTDRKQIKQDLADYL